MSPKTNTPERRAFVVAVDLPNGMRIAGAHRKKGEQIRLTASEARHLLLDGIVQDDAAPQADAALEHTGN